MGNTSEIYVFDMGKPVKIFEMAKKLIYLSGLKYPDDIDIKITGLRPGEKLYEELIADGENTKETYNKKIFIGYTTKVSDAEQEWIEQLIDLNHSEDKEAIKKKFTEIVPEYAKFP